MSESPFINDIDQNSFTSEVLEKSREVPVLVDFWADWCAPCQALAPVLYKLVDEYQGKFLLAKVDTDKYQALAGQYGVRGLPTVKVFKDGEIVDEFTGAQPESFIREIIERHIEHESDLIKQQAIAALQSGDTQKALELMQQAVATEPEKHELKIDLAKVLLAAGDAIEAENTLKALPALLREETEVKGMLAQLEFARLAAAEPDVEKLERTVNDEPENVMARYQLSAHKILSGDYEAALENLFEIVRRDRKFEDDAGRKAMLAVFDMLGGSGELVSRYRSKLFNVLH